MINRIKCWIFGHDLYLIQRMSQWGRKLECCKCRRIFAYNTDCGIILSWDDSFDEFYADIRKFNEN